MNSNEELVIDDGVRCISLVVTITDEQAADEEMIVESTALSWNLGTESTADPIWPSSRLLKLDDVIATGFSSFHVTYIDCCMCRIVQCQPSALQIIYRVVLRFAFCSSPYCEFFNYQLATKWSLTGSSMQGFLKTKATGGLPRSCNTRA